MRAGRVYYVYIASNQSRTLYVGVTNSIRRRIAQHKASEIEGFTRRYHIGTLVYFEVFGDVHAAILREKQIKRWRREKKIALILRENPDWRDLSDGWF
ncbi:MAG: GIY-YIG nuclease family protein [Planctomycetota bacterium]|nr:GIY-YIG nuclease family protein [Planctomycetota bacterium]